MVIKTVYERDLQPKNNTRLEVIPQVMTCSAEEFIFAAKYVRSLGYKELNWNLGCPYPMVTNKGMGSGLIKNPEKIDRILNKVHTETDIIVSMKMRMGYEHSREILDVFPVLEKYPIKNIGIHARIGAQLYNGGVDLEGFQRCIDHCGQKLYYNGDITSVAIFEDLSERFPSIDHWMLGRGLIADPFLPEMIKNETHLYPDDKMEVFSKYLDTLFTAAEQKLTGEKAVIRKMLSYWEYFSTMFPNPSKVVKKIKKAKTYEVYDNAVRSILESERIADY
ncbi:tRNA-dihydrouridine synthase [Portibacter lacus]|uniref:tRNA-dihydrouridine synthase n=2 Tax=Portibacter lacus TaxID=1099794 RepID=A0AA37SR58_9BACT|nr:tRNA-dihydrouridine synthase [Portibacter lacus]